MTRTPRYRVILSSARSRPRRRARAVAAHSTAQSITALVTAVTAIGALVFTGLSLNATRDQVAAAQRQNEVVQQGQYTDRFTKAVDQLDQAGPQHLQARLGGIYALQRLAADSPRDVPIVVSVLVGFITSTVERADPITGSGCADRVSPDIQAGFAVLVDQHGGDEVRDMDLARACLNGSDLAQLIRFDLDGNKPRRFGQKPARLNLSEAHLVGADLGEVDLATANLTGARLRGARFGLSFLSGADLTGADLTDAYLERAWLSEANLGSAGLRRAHLAGADLSGARLTGADLVDADLTGANLRATGLTGADLTATDLTGADLTAANLTGADRNATTTITGTTTTPTTKGTWW
ncbi:pentapeptide repeat-containing protein [Actinokineospora globicatena]|uniref:pentapeptide repeat-containing protein n=1 Tax=Actinokineospora globicatena TaxID=103729 RepID=UPI0020A26757|nr:pentapeptide repeat-containing protein [Actinokineospora globicatena]MCP2302453.1 Uncharacterized protein YjbI, contains pentapeptide repeats [Actinokineospora globicatena]GLW75864.1 hypothetical protein Aglo01_03460 [Actinokineospora globicatena]GLW82702.1 hypothetical protein Aglo02_03430 [Actinokineospora globicatena]